MQELATAVQHKIGVVAVVFNDGAFGNVQRMQREEHGGRVIATELRNPDFVKLAESFGAAGVRVSSPEALAEAMRAGFAREIPTVIEVPVGVMSSPWRYVQEGKVRGA